MFQARRLNRIGERVPGVVVDLHGESTGRHGQVCHPVDGRTIRTTTGVGSSPPAVKPGEQVPVLNDPRKPNDVAIDTWSGQSNWVLVVLVVIGLGVMAWAVYRAVR